MFTYICILGIKITLKLIYEATAAFYILFNKFYDLSEKNN